MSKQSQGQPSYRPADACARGKHGGAAALQQTWLPGRSASGIHARANCTFPRLKIKSRYLLLLESSMSKVRTTTPIPPPGCVKHTNITHESMSGFGGGTAHLFNLSGEHFVPLRHNTRAESPPPRCSSRLRPAAVSQPCLHTRLGTVRATSAFSVGDARGRSRERAPG